MSDWVTRSVDNKLRVLGVSSDLLLEKIQIERKKKESNKYRSIASSRSAQDLLTFIHQEIYKEKIPYSELEQSWRLRKNSASGLRGLLASRRFPHYLEDRGVESAFWNYILGLDFDTLVVREEGSRPEYTRIDLVSFLGGVRVAKFDVSGNFALFDSNVHELFSTHHGVFLQIVKAILGRQKLSILTRSWGNHVEEFLRGGMSHWFMGNPQQIRRLGDKIAEHSRSNRAVFEDWRLETGLNKMKQFIRDDMKSFSFPELEQILQSAIVDLVYEQ